MDITELRKRVVAKIANDNIRQQIRTQIKDYKDQHHDFKIGQREIFKPITSVQEETKSLIDEKQDKLIKKHDEVIQELEDNQEALINSVTALALPFAPQPALQPAQPAQPALQPAPPAQPAPTKKVNFNEGMTANDLSFFDKQGFVSPNEYYKMLEDGQIDPKEYSTRINKRLQKFGQDKGNATKQGDEAKFDQIAREQKRLNKYKSRIISITEGIKLLPKKVRALDRTNNQREMHIR